MKTCESGSECNWSDEDFKSSDPSILKVGEKNGIKTLRFKTLCDQTGDKELGNGEIRSESCVFNIGIRGMHEKDDEIHYQLSLEDAFDSHQISKDHFFETK